MGELLYNIYRASVDTSVPPWEVLSDKARAAYEAAATAVLEAGKKREVMLTYPPGSGKLAEVLITAYNNGTIELVGLKAICKGLGPEWEAKLDLRK